MPRRVIVKKDEMYRKRASAWEFHYNNRNIARGMCSYGKDGARISLIVKDYCIRELRMDGWFLDVPFESRRVMEWQVLNQCGLSHMQTDLLCHYYWTEAGWMEFVRLWQAMPEVEEDYYHRYDPLPNDRLLLVPMSSKPKRGTAPSLVDKPVDKSGTSKALQVQVRSKVGAVIS